jgi:hypothetical protein
VHRTIRGATHTALNEDGQFARLTGAGIEAVVRSARSGKPVGFELRIPSKR